jgi:hypothetical protein
MTPDLFTPHCQRWRDRRGSYRPAGELFDPAAAEVAAIDEATAKAFVIRHHYAGSYPAARFRAGLFVQSKLAGVAVFSVPMNQRTVPCYFEGLAPNDGVELGRLVLLDEVAANAESWFCARAFKLARDALKVKGIVSYSDPIARTDAAGQLVKPGHIGTVYQALNARYRGRSSARTLLVSSDGRIASERALSKLRGEDRGEAYAYDQLRNMGAPEREPFESGAAYVSRVLAGDTFRRVRHPGNHAYTWWLGDKRQEPAAAGQAYPKSN